MSFDDDMTINEAKDLLRTWREHNERRSEEVLSIYYKVLPGTQIDQLGNEKHLVMEQVIYAALDSNDSCLAWSLIMSIKQEFPLSMRMLRLELAMLEMEEKYDEALKNLDALIKSDETNAALRKRRVAILKAQGLIPEAIKELTDYLKKFMSDAEAWQELCSLYLQVQEYSKAVFCAEELLLHQPHNHLAYQRIADIRYTMGGLENMELAKTYYSQALTLNPDNMRAILGLFLTANNLLNQYKSSGASAKRKEATKLCAWAQAQAKRRSQPTTPGLTECMQALAITE